jgi:carbon monoxide dehydrogenase subunit G
MLSCVRAELTIEVARTPEDVFAYLTNVSNLPAWQSGVRRAQIEDAGAPRVGARIREARHMLGRELNTTLEITEYDPPRVFSLRALDSPVPFIVRHELEPNDGGTRLTVTGVGDAGLLPGFAAGVMARRAEKQFRKDFERLKRLLEDA